jgi:aryl-alcohol dehydrogenase-like predicted oxidoreductase
MRLEDERTITAALEAGITLFDTARAYPGNEELLARVLRGTRGRVVTKGGMRRDGGAWIPDGRAKAIRADCEASLAALDGVPIDDYLLHTPDQRTPWRTSLRALARLVDDGLVPAVGVSNVTRGQLDEALEIVPVAAVENALSPFDDRALRGGVVERCAERGITFIAHSPLGGPRRAGRLDAESVLAWLIALAPVVVPIPGARRPETARSAARAARLELGAEKLAELNAAYGVSAPSQRRVRAGSEVVLIMGIPGAGKSRLAGSFEGYDRLNRDERGGSLKELAAALDERLDSGVGRAVVDNTYLTRAERSRVLEVAARHGAAVRCVWLDTPLAQAQANLVERLLDRFGALPAPEDLRAGREPGLLSPTSQMRTVRALEPPEADEGFAAIERVEFQRERRDGRAGVFVAGSALRAGWQPDDTALPHLLFDWLPDGDEPPPFAGEVAVCRHGGGPPVCWCRPPLPGLPLAFARTAGVDPARSTLVGTSSAHRTLAATLGARYVDVQNERT